MITLAEVRSGVVVLVDGSAWLRRPGSVEWMCVASPSHRWELGKVIKS